MALSKIQGLGCSNDGGLPGWLQHGYRTFGRRRSTDNDTVSHVRWMFERSKKLIFPYLFCGFIETLIFQDKTDES